jgi:tRNA-dihydrouridine synthase
MAGQAMRKLFLAPLRGLTDAVFRSVFARHFNGIVEAVAPFITSTKGRRIKSSHLRDINPSDNRSLPIVPQILSNNADEFICLANTLIDMGYEEINWNLGCPYPMVAKKMRGSGLLPHPDKIDRLLDAIIPAIGGRLSIKTRLGRWSADEMDRLVPVFNRYPLARLIVHPRTGVQMYDGHVNEDAFADCLAVIVHPVVYNGDINRLTTFQRLEAQFPTVSGWMLGRGLLSDPFLAERIQSFSRSAIDRKARFTRFHDDLVDAYLQRFSGPAHVLDRMKGFWRYFATAFADEPALLKKIRKTRHLKHYRKIVTAALDRQKA